MTSSTTKKRANWRTPDAYQMPTFENLNRASWLRERRKGIGGTDAAALMGTHVGKVSPIDVFAEKMSEDEPREVDLPHFRFGHMLEARLIAEAADHHGVDARRGGMYRHKVEEWRYANPDAFTSDGGILECKTTGQDTPAAREWRAGTVSPHAYDQAQHYLAVTGRKHIYFVVGIAPPGWQKLPEDQWIDSVTEIIHVGPIARDNDRIAEIMEAERDFWPCVEKGELSHRWKPREVEAIIPEMVTDDIARLLVIKGKQTALAEERAAIERRLTAEIGREGGYLTVGGQQVARWTVYDAETFDKKGFTERYPAIAAKFTVTNQRRRFSVIGGDA
jgi:putative phage-type endonuclease